MIEVLPIKLLSDQDALIFGALIVSLGKLHRTGVSVGNGVAVTAPNLHLKTVLEHYDFGSKEVFEQSLTLVKKEIAAIKVPEILLKELDKQKKFLLNGVVFKNPKDVWINLLDNWLDQIKNRLWKDGFSKGVTEGLNPQTIFFIKETESFGEAFFDPLGDDTVINIRGGKLHPNDLKKLHDLVNDCNKKLFIPHVYEWILDGSIKLVGIKPYTSVIPDLYSNKLRNPSPAAQGDKSRSTVKVFLDFSTGLVVEREVDGVYLSSEKIVDLNKPRESFDNLLLSLIESAETFPQSPVLFKLADKSEGMGKLRGSLRLLHPHRLFDPLIEALSFVRHKKGLTNVHIVIPFVRGVSELLQIKRELAVKKLNRKNSLKILMELAIPENVVNLEDYLISGLDGVVLNLDELISHLNGFDHTEGELNLYKNEVDGLIKFLEDPLKLLHKSKVPFIAYSSLTFNPKVLDFLIEKGVYGMVVERYEAPSIHELIRQAEKRMILRKSQ